MRILVLHQYFLMPGMPGGSRFNELTALWAEEGHDVTVVAGNLDYASGKIPEAYQGKLFFHEREGDVTVHRCYVPTTYNRSYAGRMFAFFGFTALATVAALRAPRPDVIVATSPALTIAFAGWITANLRARRVPWVFEIRDLWPESAITTGVLREDGALTKLLFLVERLACATADKINVLTPAFAENLVKRGLADRDKIFFVPNGVDVDEFVPRPRENAFRREMGWGDKFVVLYAGAHGRANAVGQLVDAAERLRDRPDILIASIGDGPERARLAEEAKRRGLDNIVFPGAQPKKRMPEVVAACDVGAAVLQNNPTFRTVYPNKVFDYMASARPVLLAIPGAAKKMVVDDAHAGVYVEPENADALANAIRELADAPERRAQMGKRGREWVMNNVSRRSLAARYIRELRRIVDDGEASPQRLTSAVRALLTR